MHAPARHPIPALLLSALLACSLGGCGEGEPDAPDLQGVAEQPEIVLPQWSGQLVPRSFWQGAETIAGIPALEAVVRQDACEIPLIARGPDARYAISVLASPDPRSAGPPPARHSLVTRARGAEYALRIGAEEPIWKYLRGGEPLVLRIALFPAAMHAELLALGEQGDPARREQQWGELAARRLALRVVRVHPDAAEPVLEPLIADGSRLDLDVPGERSLVLRLREAHPWRAWIGEISIPPEAWHPALELPWPRGDDGQLAARIAFLLEDRAGRQVAGELKYLADPDGESPPPYIPSQHDPAVGGDARIRLPGWDGEVPAERHWIALGYSADGASRRVLRRLASRAACAVAVQVQGVGEALVLEVKRSIGRPIRSGDPRVVREQYRVAGGDRLPLVITDLQDRRAARHAEPVYVELNLWREAVTGGAPLDSRAFEIYGDFEVPVLTPLLRSGAALSFGGGRPLFEFLLEERFPAELSVNGEPLQPVDADLEPIEASLVVGGELRLPEIGRRLRPRALRWPLDANGDPQTSLELVCRDRCGRTARTRVEYELDPDQVPLPAAVAVRRTEETGPGIARVRLGLRGAAGEWSSSRWEWTVRRPGEKSRIATSHQRVCAYPEGVMRFAVEGPEGDYRIELNLGGSLQTTRHGRFSDGIYDLRAGREGVIALNLSGLDREGAVQSAGYARLTLYAKEDLPGYLPDAEAGERAAVRARALDVVHVQFFVDERPPRVLPLIPEGSAINPSGDPGRPWPALCLAIEERFPEALRVAGRAVELEEPALVDELDPRGMRLVKTDRRFAVPWPGADLPEGPLGIRIDCRDRRGSLVEQTFQYVVDRTPPELRELGLQLDNELIAAEAAEVHLSASEALGEALWIEPPAEAGGCERVERFAIQGATGRLVLPFGPVEKRRGTLVLIDRAGNETRLEKVLEN